MWLWTSSSMLGSRYLYLFSFGIWEPRFKLTADGRTCVLSPFFFLALSNNRWPLHKRWGASLSPFTITAGSLLDKRCVFSKHVSDMDCQYHWGSIFLRMLLLPEAQIFTSYVALAVKNFASAGDLKDRVWSLGWEDPMKKEMETHSHILVWRIPWTEESGGYNPWGSQRVRHNSATNTPTDVH